MATREPNTRLALLRREAGWTNRQFVMAVNRIGTERGTPTKYQQPSVSQWISGLLPKEETRPLILEALARRLERPITADDAGFPPPAHASAGHSGTVDELIRLGTADIVPGRRGILGAASLFSVALAIPGWPDVVGRMEAVKSGSAVRVGMADVDVVTRMTERLGSMYDDFGGRTARPLAAAFLVNEVVPYLHADASAEVRHAMLSAAAFLSYLTGWMAVDEGLRGLAQKYYTKGLELAGASSDHLTYCHVLRGMSVQAADLGHGPTAVRLADAASAASPQTGPRMRAFMSGQRAHSYAVAGNRAEALRSIRETEKALDIAESGAGSFGNFAPSTLAYATSQVRYWGGDVAGSVESLQLHFTLRDSDDSQVSGLRFGALLAERQLELGHLEAACHTWGKVLDERAGVRSGRVDQKVAEIIPRLRPYASNATARHLCERVAQRV
ncbi:tetratricopeptide repeat protein [Streptomyces yaizuensis]|uniref:Tetratricopeptide repeat protein n=1 Tax=Streptomyces yaizuensis TaxID=2989713 RepID=A0ABQ5NUE3_9ACTN|nr:tetratricopeptide repeat protein [Streptomyces sp. YSPA8]GLF93987.1 tetratricopeptide repeat protein [Streptomyces sp. YSPA8]